MRALILAALFFAFPALAWTPGQPLVISVAGPPLPVFDTYPALAPQAYCGVIKLRSAYAGNALQLALGSNTATTLNVGWVTNARGVQVADDAAVQTWLAANGNTWAWVKTCYDQSGNGFDYTAHTLGTDAPIYRGVTANNLPSSAVIHGSNQPTPPLAEWLGLPSMNFFTFWAPGSQTTYLNINSGITTSRQSASFMMATTLNDERSIGVAQCCAWLNTLGADNFLFGVYHGNVILYDLTTIIGGVIPPAIDWSVKGYTASASQLCAYDDLTSNCQTNPYAANTMTGGTVGGDTTEGTFDGSATAVIGPWTTALTPTQYGQVRDAVKAQLGIAAAPSALVVFDGDSIGEGLYGTFSEHHIQRALARIYNDIGVRVRAYNTSFSGACVGASGGGCAGTLNTTFATNTSPILTSGTFAKRILYMMGGTNDIAAGTSAATTSGYVTTYIANARAAAPGVKVVYGGMISRTGAGIDATCYTFMQNVLTAASYDLLTGWYNDANMKCTSGGGTNYSNTTYFNTDAVHPNNLGHDVGSAYDATALESLLP